MYASQPALKVPCTERRSQAVQEAYWDLNQENPSQRLDVRCCLACARQPLVSGCHRFGLIPAFMWQDCRLPWLTIHQYSPSCENRRMLRLKPL